VAKTCGLLRLLNRPGDSFTLPLKLTAGQSPGHQWPVAGTTDIALGDEFVVAKYVFFTLFS